MNSPLMDRSPSTIEPMIATPWVDADHLHDYQREFLERIESASVFLEGPAGSGKTTAALHRAYQLLKRMGSQERLLVIVPQRSLAVPYLNMLDTFPSINVGRMMVLTLGGLARRMAELFWPVYSREAGFVAPDRPPTFLTLETAMYVMANTIKSFLEQGAFDGLAIERNQLLRQILDNLNKAALVGFPIEEIGLRLRESWIGKADQGRIYDAAQQCAQSFRQACLERNMLDFSLQVEILFEYILPSDIFHSYRPQLVTHLIADNIEEDAPRSHDLLRDWLPALQSSLLVYDSDAGFRRFLGADPIDGRQLKETCEQQVCFETNLVSSPEVQALGSYLAGHFSVPTPSAPGSPQDALHIVVHRYLPESVEWITQKIRSILDREHIPGSEIVLVSPYLSDSTRFLLGQSLATRGIEWIAYRPSRPIRREPAARSLLTLAALAHPGWEYYPSRETIGRALAACIAGLDPVRADLFARILYKPNGNQLWLEPFDRLRGEMQDRLTYALGQKYDFLRSWLLEYMETPPLALDHFMRKLFGEVLTQSGFGFEGDLTSGSVISTLIESIRKFRSILGEDLAEKQLDPGRIYLQLVQDGIVSAQDLRQSSPGLQGAVAIMPAFTFLMNNRPVSYQFWLDLGSQGWAERIYQPLTHPYVLNRQWRRGEPWTDENETQIRDQIAATLCLGLSRRCRSGIFAVWSEFDERGYEQRGPLLKAFQSVLRETGVQDGG